jgi:hypothetical protein
MAKTKYNPRRRMTHISHARLFLKGSLHQGGEVQRQALETFRKFYRANDSKLEALLTENAELTIGRRTETFNSRCFFINGQPISVKLTKPTAHGIVANALRLTEYWTRPDHLKRQRGIEMDHQNTGGFERIKQEFIAAHGLDTVRSAIDDTEQLSGDLRSAFVSFHASKTNDYSLCKMLTIEEHHRITQQRMLPQSEL